MHIGNTDELVTVAKNELVYCIYMVATFSEMCASDEGVAEVAGALNLANASMTRVVRQAIDLGTWSGVSPTQWLTHQAGITRTRADLVIAVAEKRHLFPTIIGRFDRGELSLEQVAELVKAPPSADAHLEDWALVATPSRIRRSIKMRYGPESEAGDDAPADGAAETQPEPSEIDRVTVGITDDHRWQIRGEFDLDTGSMMSAVLMHAREELWNRGQREISQADCLREVFERYADGIESPLRRDRSKVWLHLDAASGSSTEASGVRVPDSVRDKVCCDGIIQPVWEHDGVPFNLGRAQHIVPERTRRVVRLRDRGCRVPGCDHDRIIEIHHIIHWIDGGPTDTWNLVALCPKHHRMHHQGRLGITGNADEPTGLVFTDEAGRQLEPCGAPKPPARLELPANGYRPPPMGPVEWDWLTVSWPDPAPTPTSPSN